MKIKIFGIIFILVVLMVHECFCQTVLLQVDRAVDTLPVKHGPNLDKFSHFFLSAGLVTGPDKPGARIKYGTSVELGFGARTKYKISNVYSIGFDVRSNFFDYKLDQEPGKQLPDSLLYDVERMDFYSFRIGFFNRFNLDPGRGNYLGYFIDLGIAGEWDYSIERIIKIKLHDGSYMRSSISGLPYVNRLNYQLVARVGFNKLVFYAGYRLSDLFKSSYNYPELPRLITGIEISIFRQ